MHSSTFIGNATCMVADSPAKNSINHESGVVDFDNPPIHAAHAFLDDLEGVSRTRRLELGLLNSFFLLFVCLFFFFLVFLGLHVNKRKGASIRTYWS